MAGALTALRLEESSRNAEGDEHQARGPPSVVFLVLVTLYATLLGSQELPRFRLDAHPNNRGRERYVVIHVREIRSRFRLWASCRRRWCLARSLLARSLLALRLGFVAAVIHAVPALASAQHLHLLCHDIGCVLLDAVLIRVLAGLQAPFDVN